MAKAGRRRSVVWECFEDHPEAMYGKRRVLCRFCRHDTVANPVRMVRHIVKHCPRADEHHKQICREYQSLTIPARRRRRPQNASPDPTSASTASAVAPPSSYEGVHNSAGPPALVPAAYYHHQLRTGQIVAATNQRTLDLAEAQQARDELVLAVITAGAAPTPPVWELLENEHLRRALHRLKPEFTPPSAREAQQSVLPRLCEQTQREVDAFLMAATSLTVVCSTQVAAGRRRRLIWTAVDQDARCELLAVVAQAPAEYPEEIAKRVLRFLQRARVPRHPRCLVHLCNESFGASHLARGLLKKMQERLRMEEMENDTHQAHHKDSPIALLGGCMMQQTLFLFRDALETLSYVSAALDRCMDIVLFITNSQIMRRELQRLVHGTPTQHCLPLRSPEAEDFHSFIACVRQVLVLKTTLQATLEECAESGGELELKPHLRPDETAASSTVRARARAFTDAVGDDSFWLCLELAAQVLQPFAYAAWLSECGRATSSAQLLLCWLLLLAEVRFSPLVLETEKENFHMRVVDRIRGFSEDHVLACLLLDPRIHGLGLSAAGRRRTRIIVANLGERLFGHASRANAVATGTTTRLVDSSRLVEQLVQYLNRQRPFDDDEAWETMTTTSLAPRLFWLEYAQEVPELAQVALAVLGFRAFVAPLETTWRRSTQRFRPQSQHPQYWAGRGGTRAGDWTAATSGDEVLVPPVELVRFHQEQMRIRQGEKTERQALLKKYAPGDLSADSSDSQTIASSVDLYLNMSPRARGQEVVYSLPDHEVGMEESSRCGPDGGDAVAAFRQLKSWLQRLDEHEKSLPVDDSDASLQRFDADWLELGPESPQHIRTCLEHFLVGHKSGEAYGHTEAESADDGMASLASLATSEAESLAL